NRPDRRIEQLGQISAEGRICSRNSIQLSRSHIAGRLNKRRLVYGGNYLLGRNAVLLQLVRIEGDDDGSLGASERRWSRNAFERRKQRPHPIQRNVLQVALCTRWTAENQLRYGNAAGVESRDKRRHSSGRHEGAGAGDVAHRLPHRLRHIHALMEDKLEQSLAWYTSAFHVIDTGDVDEVIFVVVRQISFHLLRVHAAIWLRNIDHRIADLWKDIHRHSLDGQYGTKRNRDKRNHDC